MRYRAVSRSVSDAFLVRVHVRQPVVQGPSVVFTFAKRHELQALARQLFLDHVPALDSDNVVNLVWCARVSPFAGFAMTANNDPNPMNGLLRYRR
ncbi:unnamed protein product [Macrosiphum euphorbiae]|uniref:Uncharacterized protein n=1 Tax=Macrosiphum euphorbiae TaxID=13131 RepID=A0AAV0XF84_9HEMI|nr:unnamed protein product [Macrosiphum euphorbiae]